MKIAVIQDSVEATRQPHADNAMLYLSTVRRLMDITGNKIELRIVGNKDIRHYLHGITNTVCDCLVFASNSFIEIEGEIRQTVASASRELATFVRSGGSIVVLHQGRGTEPLREALIDLELLEAGASESCEEITYKSTRSEEGEDVIRVEENHSLLWFPNQLRDPIGEELADEDSGLLLFYGMVNANRLPLFDQVLATTGTMSETAVLASHQIQEGGRVILSTIPADWGAPLLLENLLYYALVGHPRVLLIGESGKSEKEGAQQTIRTEMEDLASVVTRTWPEFHEARYTLQEKWLLDHVGLIVTGDEGVFKSLKQEDYAQTFVRSGRSVLFLDDSLGQDRALSAQAELGSTTARAVARTFLTELASLPETRNQDRLRGLVGPFEDRNIICAYRNVEEQFPDLSEEILSQDDIDCIGAYAVAGFEERDLVSRDFGTALASAEVLIRLSTPERNLTKTCSQLLEGREPIDRGLNTQLNAIRVLLRDLGVDEAQTSWGNTARWLDTLHSEDQPDQLNEEGLGETARVARAIRLVFEVAQPTVTPERLDELLTQVVSPVAGEAEVLQESSVEAVAEVALLIVLLLSRGAQAPGAVPVLAEAKRVIHNVWAHRNHGSLTIGQLAIASEALISMEKTLQSGTKGLVEYLLRPVGKSDSRTSPLHQAQEEAATKRLLSQNVVLKEAIHTERELARKERLAANLGRGLIDGINVVLLFVSIFFFARAIIFAATGNWAEMVRFLPAGIGILTAAWGLHKFARERGLSLRSDTSA